MGSTSSLPGITSQEVSPAVPAMRGVQPLRGFLIGKFAEGTLVENVPQLVGAADIEAVLGGKIPGSAAYDADAFLSQGNRYLYVCKVAGTAATITVNDQQTPTPEAKFKFTAKVDGTWANYAAGPPKTGIQIVIADDTGDTFQLAVTWNYVEKGTATTYTETYRMLTLNPTSAQYWEDIINAGSDLLVATDLTPAKYAAANLPANGTSSLASGVEPDYDDGLDAMAQVNGRLVVMTDTDDASVGAAVTAAMAARSGSAEARNADGSICVLNVPQYTSVAAIAGIAEIVIDNRTVIAGPWVTARCPVTDSIRSFRSAPFLAGVRCNLPYYKSATYKPVVVMTGCERTLTKAEQLTLLQAGVTVLYRPGEDDYWRVMSGESTDGTETFARLIKDYEVAMGIANLAWVIGENQGEADPDPTRTSVVAMFASTYEAMKSQGIIERYLVQCDADNNPPADIEARQLTIRREVKYKNVVNTVVDEVVAGVESVIAVEL